MSRHYKIVLSLSVISQLPFCKKQQGRLLSVFAMKNIGYLEVLITYPSYKGSFSASLGGKISPILFFLFRCWPYKHLIIISITFLSSTLPNEPVIRFTLSYCKLSKKNRNKQNKFQLRSTNILSVCVVFYCFYS